MIRYAGNFLPSWAGAIAIDLLPAVLVFILMITQAAIRSGRDGVPIENTMTLAELRAALAAVRDVELAMERHDTRPDGRVEPRLTASPTQLREPAE